MKLYSLLFVALLTGCSTTVPVVMKFPAAPPSLKEPCAALKKVEGESASIVDLTKTVIENYTTYHECSIKVDEWNTWYIEQKKIFEEVK
jgi:alpha-L-arabinofuranosidase